MTEPNSLPPSYFDALYAADPDPWKFASSDYERLKYQATLEALPRARFRSGLEVGCSIGVLTRQVALRCAALLAVDVAEAALAEARRRCAGLPQVRIERRCIPEDWPRERFDLILLSEVLYYLAPAALARTAELARASLEPDGAILLVHYILPTDYPASGDAASEQFILRSGLAPRLQRRAEQYRLDLLAG